MSENDLFTLIYGFSGGIVVYQPHSVLGPRIQKGLQLVYVLEGSMKILVDDKLRKLGPNQITLLLPGHRETFYMDPDITTRHGWTSTSDVKVSTSTLKKIEPQPKRVTMTHRMRETLRLLEPLFSDSSKEIQAERDALSLLLLTQYLGASSVNKGEAQRYPPSVQQALDFIRQHFDQPMAIPDLAKAAGLSSGHLIRLFQKHLAVTPMHFVWAFRMAEAKRLLEDTGFTHAEIAFACGFQTPDHFSRRMKKRYGLSPRILRRMSWEGVD